MNTVIKSRENKRIRLSVAHLADLFKSDSRVDVLLLAKFQEELDLDVIEIKTPKRRIIYNHSAI